MVKEAEEYAEEDKAVKDRIDARNSLESYLYNMKNLLDDEEKGVASKISEADKEVGIFATTFWLFCSFFFCVCLVARPWLHCDFLWRASVFISRTAVVTFLSVSCLICTRTVTYFERLVRAMYVSNSDYV